MTSLRVALSQINTVVGDLDHNVDQILRALNAADEIGADIACFPELAITGYPPEDLVLKPGFVQDSIAACQLVASRSSKCVAIFGFVDRINGLDPKEEISSESQERISKASSTDEKPDGEKVSPDEAVVESKGPPLQLARPVMETTNSAAIACDGSLLGTYAKRHLPNYAVFDEERTFTPGNGGHPIFVVGGVGVGVSICEDAWVQDGPLPQEVANGARLLIVINASPYAKNRIQYRKEILRARFSECGTPIAYVNAVGGQDELVFDGASMVLDAQGDLIAAAPQFKESMLVVDIECPDDPAIPQKVHMERSFTKIAITRRPRPHAMPLINEIADEMSINEEVYEALVLGTKDYVEKNGFPGVVIGLSGGIDSSLVATIAKDALGEQNVLGIGMPSRYSSKGSIDDARELANNLGISFEVIPIESVHASFEAILTPLLGSPLPGLTGENLQSRIRGIILMAVSNATGRLVLTTGNKSELAVGYSTLYGDSAGGYGVIKDVLKTEVFQLVKWRNSERGMVIPQAVIDKPPSAELREDQRDDQSLPSYDVLDAILVELVEGDRTPSDFDPVGIDPSLVNSIARMIDSAEHKRRQNPPGVRVTSKAFGKDRRVPITNRYRPHGTKGK
ncbi:MAG: NAD+ synthase [Acidimicrobiales bacterium]|nr:NAD+ synthase [Acidimicrobiales bacterium]